MSDTRDENLLELRHVVFSFHTYGGIVHAVRDVSFGIRKGEILGIVGESGCGKSVTAQSILRINPEPPGFFEGGEILWHGRDILKMKKKELRQVRTHEIGFVFQDPMTSLNPTMKVGHQIEEVFLGRTDVTKAEVKEKTLNIMREIGISDAEKRYGQYPHELSGGMKQRIMIAIAMVSEPELIICDEPTTSLDVTIEAQILDLLLKLRRERGTAIIMITHDLGVIAKLCDRVNVMYGGEIVETGTSRDIFYRTGHPYTKGLMESIARINMDKDAKLKPIEGSPPDLFAPPSGCPFAARCEYCMKICQNTPPEWFRLGEGHQAACWLHDEMAPESDIRAGKAGEKPGEAASAAGLQGLAGEPAEAGSEKGGADR